LFGWLFFKYCEAIIYLITPGQVKLPSPFIYVGMSFFCRTGLLNAEMEYIIQKGLV